MKILIFVTLLTVVTVALGQDSNENKIELIEVSKDVETATIAPLEIEAVTSSMSPTSKQPTLKPLATTTESATATTEFNDVSLVVIPKTNDPQLSLLNMLLKSAQKSNIKSIEEKRKKEEVTKVNGHNEDNYSKYKKGNYEQATSIEPSIESRAPYHVDISSTLQPVLNIHPRNSNGRKSSNITRIPLLRIFKPVPIEMQPQNTIKKISKRSIDTSFLDIDSNVLSDNSIPDESKDDRDLLNTIEHSDNQVSDLGNDFLSEYKPEFILLGAAENCGPGRRRNSYQVCVPVTE